MKTVLGILSVMLSLFGTTAQAAYADIYKGTIPGYYLPYEGNLAGFFQAEMDNGTPVLVMSIDPTNYTPPFESTIVTLWSYDDVLAPDPGFTPFTAEEQVKLSQIGALMNYATNTDFFYLDYTTPPTKCAVGDVNCDNLSSGLNSVAWNIWSPESVPMVNWASEIYVDFTSGNYDAFDWTLSMLLMQISGGDTFVIPLGGASPQTLMQTPVPPAAWLFGSGLIGLLGAARRKAV